ncbi:PREDICTED: uncharacterized protein LOC107173452 [Diuraphis noxia]|uniref:uncharacterized protein LOC107173452 n=1 Tax=Diuraphis noxia TaxID=143948 RepID=UPI0007639E53|nr:PREDICTED: uncharacterized protein LOC107173452 [Diuraphis noxia]
MASIYITPNFSKLHGDCIFACTKNRIVMEELKKALKLQAKLYNADTAFVSISTLDMGRKYQITDISKVQSAYGLRILVSLQGDRRILKTYLPKSIKLSDSYIDGFINRDRRSVLYLIYKGVKSNGAYKIDFE